MTITEWKKTASPEAIKQYEMPTACFKSDVKCCYNCSWWIKSGTYDYDYNFCGRCTGGTYMTPWDAYCSEATNWDFLDDNLLDYLEIIFVDGKPVYKRNLSCGKMDSDD